LLQCIQLTEVKIDFLKTILKSINFISMECSVFPLNPII